MSELNARGQEVFDQTPIEYPIAFQRPTPIHIRTRNLILQAMADMRGQNEYDTPEDADDFEVDDETDTWNSPYEVDFDHIKADSLPSKKEASVNASEPQGSDGGTEGKEPSESKN